MRESEAATMKAILIPAVLVLFTALAVAQEIQQMPAEQVGKIARKVLNLMCGKKITTTRLPVCRGIIPNSKAFTIKFTG